MTNIHECNELNKYLQDNKGEIIEIERYNDEWQLFIDCDSDYRDCTSKTITITYCPFCGEKLLIMCDSSSKDKETIIKFQTGGVLSQEALDKITRNYTIDEGYIIPKEVVDKLNKANKIIANIKGV